MSKKNPIVAFLLAFFPGGGLLYLGKIGGLFYTLTVFGFPLVGLYLVKVIYNEFFAFVLGLIGFVLYIINFIVTAIIASKVYHSNKDKTDQNASNPESERFYTIILSFVPGLGHFQLGLMNRGLTILVSFLGLSVMILFITAFTGRIEFLVFLLFLLVIWVYGFFDVMQQLTKKQQGEELVDRSILEEIEMKREDGKKSRSIATFLSIIPGAGHLYLGMQQRGIQLMAAFLFSIYILDVLRLGIFLFIVPIIWFYSFFDGLQRASKYGREEMEDRPIISYLNNHQKWVGIGLLLLGMYYLLSNVLLPALSPVLNQYLHFDYQYWFSQYFQTVLVCILLIGGGIKLLIGNKRKGDGK
ncbi:hypothetical protein J6TS2_43210 [Heyndrickxia sporothermodurans]|nr:hypothetical protein J6TS2_43210 [Heyndrickxia sporothermodurans]